MSEAEVTRDPDRIKAWAEARGGRPSIVSDTRDNSRPGGILRFDFGKKDDSLDEVSWDEFFRILDENSLAVLLQEKTKNGNKSRFCKFVDAAEHGLKDEPAPRAAKEKAPGKEKAPARPKAAAKAEAEPEASRKTASARAARSSGAAAKASGEAAPASKAPTKKPSKANGKSSGITAPAPQDQASEAPASQASADPTHATVTHDHDTIRAWAEARGGRPCIVEGTEGGESGGLLRLDFGKPDENLKEIPWEDFFAILDRSGAGFLHQDETKSGNVSRFNKFVDEPDPEPEAADEAAPARGKSSARKAAAAGPSKAADAGTEEAAATKASGGDTKGKPRAAKAASGKAGAKAVPAQEKAGPEDEPAAAKKPATARASASRAEPAKATARKSKTTRSATSGAAEPKAATAKRATAKPAATRSADAKPAAKKPAAAKASTRSSPRSTRGKAD